MMPRTRLTMVMKLIGRLAEPSGLHLALTIQLTLSLVPVMLINHCPTPSRRS